MSVARPLWPTKSITRAQIDPKWWVVDASGKTLGRLATRVASVLRGKHRAQFTPHDDTGDFVIIVNAEKIYLSGRKRENKIYYRHSGWTGGLRSRTAGELLGGPHAERVVEHAVRGMLPKNSLGRKLYRKLKVYTGTDHPHAAQKPQELTIG